MCIFFFALYQVSDLLQSLTPWPTAELFPSSHAILEGLSEGNGCLPNDEDICRSSLVDWSCSRLWVTRQGQLWEIDQLIGCCHRQPQGWLFFCQQVRGSLGANILSSITAAVGVLLLTLNLSQDFSYMNYCKDLNEDDGCFGASLVTVRVSSGNTLSVKPHFSSWYTIPLLEFLSHHLKLGTFRGWWPYSHIP